MTAVEDLLKKQAQKRHSEVQVKSGNKGLTDDVDDTKALQSIHSIIESSDIVVFSKSYCPFCRQAKMALRSVPNLDFKVVEMDDGTHDGWQANVAQLAKVKAVPEAANNNTKSVPQIFVKQQYVGGADDLADMFTDDRLATMLGRKLYG